MNCDEPWSDFSRHEHDNRERDAGESIGTLVKTQNGANQAERKDRRSEDKMGNPILINLYMLFGRLLTNRLMFPK